WPDPLHRLSPVKRMQVEAIGGDRSAFGPSQCARSMDVIHPLLSQPLVEYGLSISAMTLTAGRRDRALARDAFAGRLPATVLTRRGKGSLTTYFGRTLAKSTPFLREYLLGGALSEARLIDESALASTLTPEYLMQHDCYAQVIALLQIEAWLRTWRDRLAQPRS
ncbi:MAG: asparagine synthase-related protein, partial [Hyphomicrobiaceae bacterium]